MPIIQPSTSIIYDDAIELAERQPPHFYPPKQPPPDRDTIGVGPTMEGFCSTSEGAGERRYCMRHFRGCQRNHNISREGVLDIGYLMHPGKALDAGIATYRGLPCAGPLFVPMWIAHRHGCDRPARKLANVGGNKSLSLPGPSAGYYLPPKPGSWRQTQYHGGRDDCNLGRCAHNIVTP